jgi:hypothetical protein
MGATNSEFAKVKWPMFMRMARRDGDGESVGLLPRCLDGSSGGMAILAA